MTYIEALPVNITELKNLYTADSTAKSVLDEFASRQRNQRKTKLEILLSRLAGSGVIKADVIRVLRKLEELGCGEFVEGRRGHPTRFEWRYDITSVGKAAAGTAHVIKKMDLEDGDTDDEVDSPSVPAGAIGHKFQLRPDWQVEVVLPVDLNAREAARLSDFVKTLPFEPTEP